MSSVPQFPGKHLGTPLLTPEGMIAAIELDSSLHVPPAIVISYSSAIPSLLEARGFTRVTGYPPPWRWLWRRLDDEVERVGVIEGFGYGAPSATIALEELVVLGARHFLNLGIAGALADTLTFGDVVLCTSALRDEGVSHHYRAGDRFATSSPALDERMRAALVNHDVAFNEGPTWTIDALYRETVEEATAYRDEGIATVDMEAAALFTVGEFRSVDVAALFTVSDHLLAGPAWQVAPDRRFIRDQLGRLLDVGIDALTGAVNATA